MLKSQDFLVLIKLIGLHRAFLRKVHYPTSSRKKLFDGDNEYMENDNYLNFNENSIRFNKRRSNSRKNNEMCCRSE